MADYEDQEYQATGATKGAARGADPMADVVVPGGITPGPVIGQPVFGEPDLRSSEDSILDTLDGIYGEGLLSDQTTLPGIIDILMSSQQDRAKFDSYLERAPEYFSKQLYDLCKQSDEFSDLIDEHFDVIDATYKVKKSIFDPMILRLRNFTEESPRNIYVSLPVMDFKFPSDECSVDSTFDHTKNTEAAFKVDIPGSSGGAGRRRKVVFASNTSGIKEAFQAHVRAEVKLRTFKKKDKIFVLIEIINIPSQAYPVGQSDPAYCNLDEPSEKIYQATLGAAVRNAKATESTIIIEKEYWAKFGVTLSAGAISSLSSVILPNFLNRLNLELDVRSESLTSFKFVFHSPVGKLYELKGANRNSLHLFVE